MNRLAIVTTHPIQYYAPVFCQLAESHAAVKVFYTWGKKSVEKYDPDFKKVIAWDVPLLEGYDYEFLENRSPRPGTHHFRGIINPDAEKRILAFDPDAILVYGWAWQSHLQIIRRFSGKKKVWFRGDSTLLDQTPWYKARVRHILLRQVYRYVDLAFYVGTQNKEYFKKFGLKEHQLRFAPHAIDNNRFSLSKQIEVNALRMKLNLPKSAIVVLFAGKLEPKKDPFLLLKAFEQLSRPNLILLFAGNGVLEKELKQAAAQSNKKDHIRFLDFQNQSAMPALYQTCDIYCLPSAGPGETWGLSVNEAMAAARPVIVSDKVGCATDLVHKNNGRIFRAGDEKSLVESLQQLLVQMDEKVEMNAPGKASAEIIKDWSFENQVSIILDELKKLPCRN